MKDLHILYNYCNKLSFVIKCPVRSYILDVLAFSANYAMFDIRLALSIRWGAGGGGYM